MTLTLRLALSRLDQESKRLTPSTAYRAFSRRPANLTAKQLTSYSNRLRNHLHQQQHHALAQRVSNISILIGDKFTSDTLSTISNTLEFTGKQVNFDFFGK